MDLTQKRFWSKVEKRGDDECWLWTASKRHKGYGAFVWHNGADVVQGRAHRYMWEMANGPIPAGMFVLHRCDNPPCVNPAHLFLGTNADNVSDMVRKGRNHRGPLSTPRETWNHRKGVSHHMAVLNPDQVRSIRSDYSEGKSMSAIARSRGIGLTTVFKIIHRRTWSHVE